MDCQVLYRDSYGRTRLEHTIPIGAEESNSLDAVTGWALCQWLARAETPWRQP